MQENNTVDSKCFCSQVTNELTRKLDNVVVRILIAIFIVFPATLFVIKFGFRYLMFGLSVFYSVPATLNNFILFAPKLIIPLMSVLGMIGAWMRIAYSHKQMTPEIRRIFVAFIMCGIFASIYSIGLAVGSYRPALVILYLIYILEGALLIIATPKIMNEVIKN